MKFCLAATYPEGKRLLLGRKAETFFFFFSVSHSKVCKVKAILPLLPFNLLNQNF